MKLIFLTALIFFVFTGSVYLYGQQKKGKQKKITYLALGDSYTIGESVLKEHRWPVLLVEKLRQNKVNIENPVIIAKTGWTTGELNQSIDDTEISGTFDLVSLLIGVNNQYRGLDVEEYRMELMQLLNKAVTFAGENPERVFVLSIPDWGVMPFAKDRNRPDIASKINLFNTVKKEECEKQGIRFVDITDISRRAAKSPELIASDGLHPSAEMYAEWVERIYPEVVRIIEKETEE